MAKRGPTAGRVALGARLRSATSLGALVPLIGLWIALAIASPVFLTSLNIKNLLTQFAVLGILAAGTSIVMISEEIDLSIGAVLGLGAVVAGLLMVDVGLAWPLAVVAAVASGALVGLANGLLTTVIGVPSFVATLGSLGVVSGLALSLTSGESVYGFPSSYHWLGQGDFGLLPVSVVFTVVIVIVLHVFLRHSRPGLHIYAVGGNRQAAEFMGANLRRLKVGAFVISGSGAAFAGVIVSSRLDAANPTYGTTELLDAIAAIVIGGVALTGGVGSVLGAVTGALLITTIRNGLNLLGVSPFLQTTAVGSMIIAAVILERVVRIAVRSD